ncbi:hypothetical protein ACP4OV_003881 [Aristida adscensionis]
MASASNDLFGTGTPARVLCLEPGTDAWADVSASVLAHLQHAVSRGAAAARVLLAGGRWHIFDFYRRLRVDEAAPAARPAALAWFDEAGTPFFPPPAVTAAAGAAVGPTGALAVDPGEAVAVFRTWTLEGAVVTGVRGCAPTPAMLRMFAEREAAVGNVKLAWYGAAPGDVQTAGEAAFFRRPNWTLLGEQNAHGHGLHLSPLRFPHLSMSIAEADDRGEACVLLCRIVHGVPVVVHAGANCTDHENSLGAVDYMSNPSWDLGPMPTPVKVNRQKLYQEFKRFLPSSTMQTLDMYFNVNMGHPYNFSKAVCELVGNAIYVGAILKSLEY